MPSSENLHITDHHKWNQEVGRAIYSALLRFDTNNLDSLDMGICWNLTKLLHKDPEFMDITSFDLDTLGYGVVSTFCVGWKNNTIRNCFPMRNAVGYNRGSALWKGSNKALRLDLLEHLKAELRTWLEEHK